MSDEARVDQFEKALSDVFALFECRLELAPQHHFGRPPELRSVARSLAARIPAAPPADGPPVDKPDNEWHALYRAIEDALGEPFEDWDVERVMRSLERQGYGIVLRGADDPGLRAAPSAADAWDKGRWAGAHDALTVVRRLNGNGFDEPADPALSAAVEAIEGMIRARHGHAAVDPLGVALRAPTAAGEGRE